MLLAMSWQNSVAQTYHLISSGSLTQDWSNTGLITTNDDWIGLTSIRGFLGDDPSTTTAGTDPQTIVASFSTLDVIANLANTTSTAGGVGEFEITDATIGLQGSGTADYPHILFYVNTTGRSNISVQYDLRDIDGTSDNAVQPVALQYRIGSTNNFINVPAGFVADATTGPSLATLVTHVKVTLPSECNNKAEVQIRIITANASGNDEWVGIDNIVLEVDATAPAPSFNPANAATGVLLNTIATITFDEPILKADGSVVTNADLASLVTFKETDAAGAAVAFTAVIDVAKKVITVTPTATLKGAQAYYLAVGPVKDAAGNESTLKSAVFTTISATTPTVTLVYPNGGEKLYSGDQATITWTTTNFDASENVKIEVYLPENIWYTIEASTPNDGSQVVNVGPKADYGTTYLIRVSGVTNGATDQSDNPFTIIATSDNLADLRSYDVNSIIKYTGAATITYARTSYNQKFIQDATAAILIHDPSNFVGTYAAGSGITNVEGKLTLYNGLLQLVPQAATGATATGPTITPATVTITNLTSDDQSKLVKLTGIKLATPTGNWTSGANFILDGVSASYVIRTAFSEADYIGTTVPTGYFDAVVLVGQYNNTIQVTPRNSADITSVPTGIEKLSSGDQIKLYPVPATSVLNVSGVPNLRSVEILDIAGKVIRSITTSTDEVIRIPVSDLRKGTYMLRFNTTNGSIIRKFVK